MENTITVEPNTIFLCIGPTNSGKTTFIKNLIANNKKKLEGLNVQILGSDQIRKELLGEDLFRYDPRMLEASDATFRVFEAKLKALTQYPINADIIFLDCTSLHPDFRKFVSNTAKESCYNLQALVFNYKDTEDHMRYAHEGYEHLVYRNLKKFRTTVLPTIKAKDFDGLTKIRSKDFGDWELGLKNFDLAESYKLDPEVHYSIIGDIHGCFDEFQELLLKLGSKIENGILIPPENRKFISIGDLIDKGPETKKVVDFVLRNIQHFIIIRGNHEYGNYQYLTGQMKKGTWTPKFINEWFDTIRLAEQDPDLKQKLLELVEYSAPFASHPNFICTHVPCKSKFLGRVSKKGVNGQVRWSYPHREDRTLEEYAEHLKETLSYLKEESDFNLPYHIFGHIATANTIRYSKKIGIDLGCYKGGKLQAVTFYSGSKKPEFCEVESKQPKDLEGLPDLTPAPVPVELNLEDLDPKDMVKMRKICANKINFLSGTVCPADKDTETNELESLEKGLNYFKDNGVNKVHLQTKYMGSRGTVYLTPDNETSFVISRNGFKIGYLDFSDQFSILRDRVKEYFDCGAEIVIIDAEIMPWAAMGKGLIEKEFGIVGTGLASEQDILKNSGFYEQLDSMSCSTEFIGYLEDKKTTSKKDLVEKYGHSKFSTYRALDESEIIESYTEDFLIQQYFDQLKLYGEEGDLHIEPFCLLKVVYPDSETTFFTETSKSMFQKVNPEGRNLEVDFSDPDYLEKAQAFYDELTLNMEGIVIKPEIMWTPGIAPYMKVRNPRYLSIIYGYDYQKDTKFQRLIRQKNIARKLRASIQEYETGKSLLEVPWKEINSENTRYIGLVSKFMRLEKKAESLDPRL